MSEKEIKKRESHESDLFVISAAVSNLPPWIINQSQKLHSQEFLWNNTYHKLPNIILLLLIAVIRHYKVPL